MQVVSRYVHCRVNVTQIEGQIIQVKVAVLVVSYWALKPFQRTTVQQKVYSTNSSLRGLCLRSLFLYRHLRQPCSQDAGSEVT